MRGLGGITTRFMDGCGNPSTFTWEEPIVYVSHEERFGFLTRSRGGVGPLEQPTALTNSMIG